MLRNNSWSESKYGFDGTRADLSEPVTCLGASVEALLWVCVPERVSGTSCCGSKAVDSRGTFEFCQCFRADSRVFKTAGEVRRTRGALQMQWHAGKSS